MSQTTFRIQSSEATRGTFPRFVGSMCFGFDAPGNEILLRRGDPKQSLQVICVPNAWNSGRSIKAITIVGKHINPYNSVEVLENPGKSLEIHNMS